MCHTHTQQNVKYQSWPFCVSNHLLRETLQIYFILIVVPSHPYIDTSYYKPHQWTELQHYTWPRKYIIVGLWTNFNIRNWKWQIKLATQHWIIRWHISRWGTRDEKQCGSGEGINRRGVGGRVDRIQTMPCGCKDVIRCSSWNGICQSLIPAFSYAMLLSPVC